MKKKKSKLGLTDLFLPTKLNNRRPHALRHKWLTVYSLGLLLSQLVMGVSFYSGPGLVTENFDTMKTNIIELTNAERAKSNLGVLKESSVLDKAAQDKLNDMFKNNYWDHESPSGRMPWDFITADGYNYSFAGENLAKGYVDSATTVKAWMDSPSHKNNLLSGNYQEIGVAVGTGKIDGRPTSLVVQMFGSPQTSITAKNAVVMGAKQENLNVNPALATILSRLPYFLVWFIIFGLIIFDGSMLRILGLHTSRKHMFQFRAALLVNVIVFMVLCINFVAIA